MASPGHMMGPKKHKKHKSDRRERLDSSGDRPPGLKLILKVGNQATPEHTTDFGYGTHGNEEASCGGSGLQPMSTGVAAGGAIGGAPLLPPVVGHHDNDPYYGDTDVMMTSPGSAAVPSHHHRTHHKKSKKKKKKKDKSKDRDRDREGGGGKEQRKHRHHHKDKKRKREHATSDSGPGGDPVHAGGGGATTGGNAVVAGATSAVNDENRAASSFSPSYPEAGGSPSQHREPRTCVLRKIQERTALQKMLDQLLGPLEKKDPQQFFAWPVTDNIAPGYSSIITQPMDFSTMRQKIEDNQYGNLQEFISDFKLMCSNAMKYNHTDTVYYKTAKKLLHFGTKIMQPEKLGWVLTLLPELTSEEVGFEITAELRQNKGGGVHADDHDDSDHHVQENKKRMPASKFEAIPDDLAPEEILAKAQIAAREAKAKLLLKRGGSSMGYLKQRKDGTTNLNILVGGDGVIPGTKKRPVLLGQLCGKLNEGTGQLQGFREDRRNIAKPMKPLYYGAFGSYAPSYDSAFSNLSKEESDLVYHTYGSDTAVQYAESVLDFVKDSDYATHLVDSLLDLLTGGDHSKTKRTLDENKRLREEEEAIKTVLEVKPIDSVKVDVDELRSLQDLGIDVNFLDTMEDEIKQSEERNELQRRLDGTCQLLERLQRSQHRRLSSAPSPQMHLGLCPPPTDEEMRAAEQIVESLADLAKRAQPGDVAPLAGIRKAMGVAMPTVVTTPPPPPGLTSLSTNEVDSSGSVLQNVVIPEAAVVADLESELRQFLESEPALNQSPLRADDKTIEEILME